MKLDRAFFEDEVRCGYPIIPMIKRGWAAELSILEMIDNVCKKYNIKYFAHCGTLLGAVRHKGFVPWDDDIDIAMIREDYMRFLEVAPKELPKNYAITNVFKKDMHTATITGILHKTRTCLEDEFIISNYGCPSLIGVDIFVLDYLPGNQKELDEFSEALDFIRNLRDQYGDLTEEEKKLQLSLVKDSIGVNIEYSSYDSEVTFRLGQVLEDICKLYSKKDSCKLANMMVWQKRKERVYDASWYESCEYVDFEAIKIPIPVGAKEILKVIYGDYTELKRRGGAHKYPYFENQYLTNYEKMGGGLYTPESMLLPRECTNNTEKNLVIFVVCQEKRWSEIDFAFKREIAAGNDVFVMPVPYFVKDITGNAVEMIYEGNYFPTFLPLVDYEEYDLAGLHPEKIYFQTPWDEWHEVIQLPAEYCCSELYACSDVLTYVPTSRPEPFGEDDARTSKMLDYSVRFPGMIIADNILVDDECLRNNYINALTKFTGEHTKSIWEKKVVC